MLYTIGTEKELARINLHLPTQVFTELLQGIIILDAEYGKDRDYFKVGGYSVILETAEDVLRFKEISTMMHTLANGQPRLAKTPALFLRCIC